MPRQSKLLHSDIDTQKCLLDIDTRDSENSMTKLDVIYDNENDRKYVAEEIEEDTSKPYKGPPRKILS